MENISMKNNKLQIRYIFELVIFLILCYIGIANIRVNDNNNIKKTEYDILLKTDSLTEVEFSYEEDTFLDYLEIEVPKLEENIDIYYNLINEKGYCLETGGRTLEGESQNVRIVLENKIQNGIKYTLQMRLEESEIQNIDAKIAIEFVGYKNIGKVYQAVFMLMCLFIAFLVFIVITENQMYMKAKEAVWSILASRRTPTIAEYAILTVFFAILLMSNGDGDTLAFVHYEVNFWRSIFQEGGLQHFYDYSYMMEQYYKANAIGGAFAAYYDFPMFILFGIWGLPLYLLCEGMGIEETSNMWTIVYGKSIFIVALIIAAYVIYKICQNIKISKEQSKWAVFLFLSSILALVDVGYIGQLDIMGIIFTLIGIYYYQKNSKWKFILFFMIASSFKQFPVFIFIPLLMLIEKNIVKIGIDTLIVLGFSKICGLSFPSDTMAITVKNEFAEKSLEALLGVKAPLYNDTIPVIILLLGVLCVYCYLKKITSQKELEEYSVFLPLAAMFILLICFDSNPYWYIQLAPYIAIILMYNSKQYNNLVLFETVGMICLVLSQFYSSYWCFEPSNGEGMLMTQIFGKPDSYLSMERFAAYTKLNQLSGVLYAAFIVCIVAFLWISRPGKIKQDEKIIIRPYALLRMLVNIAVAYVPVMLYVVSAMFL